MFYLNLILCCTLDSRSLPNSMLFKLDNVLLKLKVISAITVPLHSAFVFGSGSQSGLSAQRMSSPPGKRKVKSAALFRTSLMSVYNYVMFNVML